jgi:hypothetical protein
MLHLALLEPYRAPADSQRRVDPPETEEIDREVHWDVREVVDSQVDRKQKKVKYLVLWEEYEEEDAT